MAGQTESKDGDVVGNKGFKNAWVVKVDRVAILYGRRHLAEKVMTEDYLLVQQEMEDIYSQVKQLVQKATFVGQHGSADAWVIRFKE